MTWYTAVRTFSCLRLSAFAFTIKKNQTTNLVLLVVEKILTFWPRVAQIVVFGAAGEAVLAQMKQQKDLQWGCDQQLLLDSRKESPYTAYTAGTGNVPRTAAWFLFGWMRQLPRQSIWYLHRACAKPWLISRNIFCWKRLSLCCDHRIQQIAFTGTGWRAQQSCAVFLKGVRHPGWQLGQSWFFFSAFCSCGEWSPVQA